MTTPTEESYRPFLDAYNFFNEQLFEGQLPVCLITFQRQKRVMGYVSLERWVNEQQQYTHELAVNPEYFATYPLIEICQTLCHEMVHIWQAHFGSPSRNNYHNMEWAKKMMRIGLMPSTTGEPGGDIVGQNVCDYILQDGAFIRAFTELESTGFRLTWLDRFPVVRKQNKVASYTRLGEKVELPERSTSGTSRLLGAGTTEARLTESDFPLSFEDLDAAFTAAFASQLRPNAPAGLSTKPKASNIKRKYRCAGCAIQLWGKPGLNVICGECELALIECD